MSIKSENIYDYNFWHSQRQPILFHDDDDDFDFVIIDLVLPAATLWSTTRSQEITCYCLSLSQVNPARTRPKMFHTYQKQRVRARNCNSSVTQIKKFT